MASRVADLVAEKGAKTRASQPKNTLYFSSPKRVFAGIFF
jgi:hypothetical protein